MVIDTKFVFVANVRETLELAGWTDTPERLVWGIRHVLVSTAERLAAERGGELIAVIDNWKDTETFGIPPYELLEFWQEVWKRLPIPS